VDVAPTAPVGALSRGLRAAGQRERLAGQNLAAAGWKPEAIFTGAAAARLSYWPELREETVAAAVRNDLIPRRGYVFSRRNVPPELIMQRGRLRCTSPALTALDLSDLEQTEGIDVALRKRATTLGALQQALHLTPNRPGNVARRLVVLDSRDGLWSFAERLAHRLLRQAGISRWRANVEIQHLESTYFLDIAFRPAQLALEIDGRLDEEDLHLFESDRWRQNALVHRMGPHSPSRASLALPKGSFHPRGT